MPFEHTWVAVHALPHFPQFSASDPVSVHLPLQLSSFGGTHDVPLNSPLELPPHATAIIRQNEISSISFLLIFIVTSFEHSFFNSRKAIRC